MLRRRVEDHQVKKDVKIDITLLAVEKGQEIMFNFKILTTVIQNSAAPEDNNTKLAWKKKKKKKEKMRDQIKEK